MKNRNEVKTQTTGLCFFVRLDLSCLNHITARLMNYRDVWPINWSFLQQGREFKLVLYAVTMMQRDK